MLLERRENCFGTNIYLLISILSVDKMSFPKCKQLQSFHFFLLGLGLRILPTIVIWIAIDDILAGTIWPTTVAFIAFSIPELLSKVFSPPIINRVPFHFSFTLITAGYVGSILLLVIIDDVRFRLAGLVVFGFVEGFAVIASVRMLAYYEQQELLANSYQNGSFLSSLLASFWYTGLTTWLCVSPRITIAACMPMCFMIHGVYIFLDKEPLKDHLKVSATRVQYTKLPEEEEEYFIDKEESPTHKLLLTYKSLPLFTYTYIGNFSFQSSLLSVLTTLTFASSPFLPRDHFQYYRLVSDTGIFFGGLARLVFGCLVQNFYEFSGTRSTAVLVVLNVIHLLFFVFASWYRFLPNVIPVLVLCFTHGIVQSLLLVQAMMCAANLFSSPHDKGTAMGVQEVGLSVGRIGAAVLGVLIEEYLREHCTNDLMLDKYCLARLPSSAGWSENIICTK